MREAAVDQGQVLEWISIEMDLNVSSVGSMIILIKIVPNMSETEKDQTEQVQQMIDLDGDKTPLKVLAADTYEGQIQRRQ